MKGVQVVNNSLILNFDVFLDKLLVDFQNISNYFLEHNLLVQLKFFVHIWSK